MVVRPLALSSKLSLRTDKFKAEIAVFFKVGSDSKIFFHLQNVQSNLTFLWPKPDSATETCSLNKPTVPTILLDLVILQVFSLLLKVVMYLLKNFGFIGTSVRFEYAIFS